MFPAGLCQRCCQDHGQVRLGLSVNKSEASKNIVWWMVVSWTILKVNSKEGLLCSDFKSPISPGCTKRTCRESCQGTGTMGLFPERFAWHCNCEPPDCWPLAWGCLAQSCWDYLSFPSCDINRLNSQNSTAHQRWFHDISYPAGVKKDPSLS